MKENKQVSIGAFAKLSGVSQRTLRFYDQKQLLQPSHVSESGRRYYVEEDLIPLQHIIALKYLGFPLEEIKGMIDRRGDGMHATLSLQREIMVGKREQLERSIKAIDHTLELIERGEPVGTPVISFLIHNILHEKEQLDWMKQHLPERLMDEIMSKYKEKELEWNMQSMLLFQRMKDALVVHEPEAEEVQQHVVQLMEMVRDMYGEDMNPYTMTQFSQESELPGFFTSPFTKEEEERMALALMVYLKEKGMLPDEPS